MFLSDQKLSDGNIPPNPPEGVVLTTFNSDYTKTINNKFK